MGVVHQQAFGAVLGDVNDPKCSVRHAGNTVLALCPEANGLAMLQTDHCVVARVG